MNKLKDHFSCKYDHGKCCNCESASNWPFNEPCAHCTFNKYHVDDYDRLPIIHAKVPDNNKTLCGLNIDSVEHSIKAIGKIITCKQCQDEIRILIEKANKIWAETKS